MIICFLMKFENIKVPVADFLEEKRENKIERSESGFILKTWYRFGLCVDGMGEKGDALSF